MSNLSALPVFIPGRPYTMPSDRARAAHLLRVAMFLWDDAHPSAGQRQRANVRARMAQRLGVAA
jgi:hypothetical protein